MQTNLIPLERALLNLGGFTSPDQRTVDALTGAASDGICKWCRRDFAARSYDEIYSGWSQDGKLLLRQYPLLSVESVRYGPTTVLKVQNTATTTNQQARVAVGRDGLILTRVASGVKVVDTSVTWATYPTLAGVAAAVTALGAGWVGTAGGDYSLFPSQDLYRPPSWGNASRSEGAMSCRGVEAGLQLHVGELSTYGWDERGWLYQRAGDQIVLPAFWANDSAEACEFPAGPAYWRVQYVAGYETVPEAVQEACAQWVAIMFSNTQKDPLLTNLSPSSGDAKGWAIQMGRWAMTLPPTVAAMLAPFKRMRVD